MLLDDLLNDSKPKARALGLARYVRIENSTQQLALKSGAIVTHRDGGVLGIPSLLEAGRNLKAWGGDAVERLERVDHKVVQDLAHTPAIGFDAVDALVELEANVHTRIVRSVEVGDFTGELVQAEVRDAHLGGARIFAKRIHHLLHGLHLLHDRARGALQHFGVRRRHAREKTPAHELGGELNG